jgi:hypothetical protein
LEVGDVTHSSRRPAVCRDLGDGRIGIWSAFEDKDRVKALPSARWDPSLKCWTVDRLFRADAERLVAALNGAGAASPAGQMVPLGQAFTALFTALAPAWRQPVHRALIKVLHPDQGGDTATVQALNDAWARQR